MRSAGASTAGQAPVRGPRAIELARGLGVDLGADLRVGLAELRSPACAGRTSARAVLVVAVAEAVEEPQDGLAHARDLAGVHELVQHDGRLRTGDNPPAHTTVNPGRRL